jgi:2-oxoglutarate ferredoxin oxidoreductase subunit alpha
LDHLQWFDSYATDDAEVIVVAYGSVARSALRAVKQARDQGLKAGLIKLKILWPFMRQTIADVIDKTPKLLVPEMNMGQISREVKRVRLGSCEVLTLNKVDGTLISPQEILRKIEEAHP